MNKMERIAVLCVSAGAGALVGLGVGLWGGAAVWGAVMGALLGPIMALVGMVFYLYFGNSTNSEDW
jgi:hypothetical protein